MDRRSDAFFFISSNFFSTRLNPSVVKFKTNCSNLLGNDENERRGAKIKNTKKLDGHYKIYSTLTLVLLFFNKPIFSPFGFPKISFWYKTSFILFFSPWFDVGERKPLEFGGRERKYQLKSLMTPEWLIVLSTSFRWWE